MEDFLKELKEFVYPEGWDDTSESSKNHSEPWNKGKKNVQKCPAVAEANRNRVWTEEKRKELSEKLKGINKGRKRPDLAERNRKRKGTNIPRDKNGRFI
jgi:hypothetical protein